MSKTDDGPELEAFRERLRNDVVAAPTPTAPAQAAPAPARRGFARPEAAISAATQQPRADSTEGTFALRLLTASGFGASQELDRDDALPNKETGDYLPQKVRYFKPTEGRAHHVLLVEFDDNKDGAVLFAAAKTLFRKERDLNLLEDALDRFARDVLKAFEGKKDDPNLARGAQHETLCVLSVVDHRVKGTKKNRLVHFATAVTKEAKDFDSFTIRQECVEWDEPRSKEYTTRLYRRAFSKLNGPRWKDAFVRDEERELIAEVARRCLEPEPKRELVEEAVVKLLDNIAGTFGFPKEQKKNGLRVKYTPLPTDHDIGASTAAESAVAAKPPEGIVVRDAQERFLGYVIYCLGAKGEAEALRKRLEDNNRFHNVLVLYPDASSVQVELWQGRTIFEGKLTRAGARFQNDGKVVSFLSRFFVISRSQVSDPSELAEELAFRARYLRRLALQQLGESEALQQLYQSFKENLLHDQTEEEFADAYAQTLTYGLLSCGPT